MDRVFFTARGIRPCVEKIAIDGAPRPLRGTRLLFVSDIHLRPSMDVDALVGCMEAQRADCVLFGGDFAESGAQAKRLLNALSRLHPPLGMFACPGNNDPEAFGSLAAMRQALHGIGCTLLVNEARRVGALTVAGLDEYKYGSPDANGLFRSGDGYRVLLNHYPVSYAWRASEAPALQLCGHTHGGQFNLFGLTPYSIGFEWLPLRRLGARTDHVSGWRTYGETRMLVSKGVGMSRIPLRIGVRSEMHLIELQ